MTRRIVLIFACFCFFSILQAVDFTNLNGSDLMLGIGARQIALGGAGTLLSDAPGSIYWNPAGLAGMKDEKLQLDMENPVQINNLIFVWNSENLRLKNYRFHLGFGIINRLRFKGNSKEIWAGYAAHLLDLTMIDVANFKGNIDSKTFDYRFSIATEISSKFLAGITFLRLD